MPACVEIHKALQDITGLSHGESETKHKDTRQSRLLRDRKVSQTIIDFLVERKPFSRDNTALRSLASGVLAEDTVNVDVAASVGNAILVSME